MAGMRVLFIGGTGTISAACADLARERGIDLWLLNRGQRPGSAATAQCITADIRDPAAARAALDGRRFDVVVDFIAYTAAHVEADLDLFRGRCGQYVFISSASAYRKPPTRWPIDESCVLANPFWQYSRDKIAAEERLVRAFREDAFPITIVRPSHTYDRARLPIFGGWTVVERMRRGAPVVVHGDGTSLWTLTHARDFARGLVGLLGNQRALGEAVHITSDEVLTWDGIHRVIAQAAGAPEPRLVHAPAEVIARFDARWGESLVGDKAHCLVFDNRKIRGLVPDFAAPTPYAHGAAEIIAWHDADAARRRVDPVVDGLFDRLIAAMAAVG
jgi:nucleoside-diphosphate-sugar epimerase